METASSATNGWSLVLMMRNSRSAMPMAATVVRFGQGGREGSCSVQAPGVPCLVGPDEDDVGPAGQVEQDAGAVGVAPQSRAEVDVEGDERPVRPGRGQLPQEGEAVVGQGGRDPGEVEYPPRPHRRQIHVPRGHRRGRRARPVVRHLVRVRRAVPRRAEVHARRPCRVPANGGHVDAVSPDRLHEVVTEAVGPDPADPLHGVPGGSQHARHVRLRAPDPPVEGGNIGEAARPGGKEGDHGLAERDDVHDVGGVARSAGGHDRRSSSAGCG
ncbi:hypothetical protein SALBM311S_11423 [Streptomyces alboniger]